MPGRDSVARRGGARGGGLVGGTVSARRGGQVAPEVAYLAGELVEEVLPGSGGGGEGRPGRPRGQVTGLAEAVAGNGVERGGGPLDGGTDRGEPRNVDLHHVRPSVRCAATVQQSSAVDVPRRRLPEHRRRYAFGRAPTTDSTTTPSRKSRIVGSDSTRYARIVSGFSSASIAVTTVRPANSSASSVRFREIARHDGHQSAQKSTNTGRRSPSTTSANVSSVVPQGAGAGTGPFGQLTDQHARHGRPCHQRQGNPDLAPT
jgi:hypothetical protein